MSNFYNKYKQLFQAKDAVVPTSRLTLNHQLFIQQPYRPAYGEQLKLSSKLIEMRKGYDDLDHQIDKIMNTMKEIRTPTHPLALESERKEQTIKPVRPVSTKLSNIFNSQRDSIVKESEMQHVFNYRLKNARNKPVEQPSPQLMLPYQDSTPKTKRPPKLQPLKKYQHYPVDNNIFNTSQKQYEYGDQPPSKISPKIGINHSRTPTLSYKQAKPTHLPYKDALAKRKDAQKRLQQRRDKLRALLATR